MVCMTGIIQSWHIAFEVLKLADLALKGGFFGMANKVIIFYIL